MVVESVCEIASDKNHGDNVMNLAGSDNHLTKGQQVAILSVMRCTEGKGSASQVAEAVKILHVGRSTGY